MTVGVEPEPFPTQEMRHVCRSLTIVISSVVPGASVVWHQVDNTFYS